MSDPTRGVPTTVVLPDTVAKSDKVSRDRRSGAVRHFAGTRGSLSSMNMFRAGATGRGTEHPPLALNPRHLVLAWASTGVVPGCLSRATTGASSTFPTGDSSGMVR
jgi:hypothetical protein